MIDLFAESTPALVTAPITIVFDVLGIPKAQPRPRAFARKLNNGTAIARVYDAGTAESWKSEIAAAVRPHLPPEPLTGPIEVRIEFILPRPQSLCRKKDPPGKMVHTSRLDLDNLEKSTLDALTHLGMWEDDGQVCSKTTTKHYHAIGCRPGARIEIRQL